MTAFRRLLAAATILASLGAPAAADAGWSSPKPLSPAAPGSVSEMDIGFDADGNALAAWTHTAPGGDTVLWAATRPAGGAWSTPKLLAGDDAVYGGDDAFPPTVVVHPGGRAAVQWTENTPKIPSRTIVAVAIGQAGGAIGDPFVPHSTGVNHDAAEAVFDAEGALHLVYDAGLSGDNRIYERTLAAGSDTWSDATPVAPAMSVPQYELDLAIDADGNRALVWTSGFFDAPAIQAAVRPAGGAWTAPAELQAGDGATRPRVAIMPGGRVVAIWGTGTAAAYGIGADAPSWSQPAAMVSDEELIDLQRDELGRLHLLTRTGSELRHRAMAVDSTSFAPFTAVDDSPVSFDFGPALAIGPDGEAAVSWYDGNGRGRVRLFDGETWKPAEEKPATTTTTQPPQVQPPPMVPPVAEIVKVLGTFPKAPVVTPAAATFEQSFPGPGQAKWDLFLGRPAVAVAAAAKKKAKPVLLGTSSRTIAAAGKVKAKIKVGAKRRAALKKAKKPAVYLRTTFTDLTGRTVQTLKKVRYKRR